MNDYSWLVPRRRRRHLLIVEGNHEKNILFDLLLKCFPEIDIKFDDILIYGTNIYMLYKDIEKEYQQDWYQGDVDLPFVISQKSGENPPLRKREFMNIILIFDYERHDPNFSQEKILHMQEYFKDAADMGKLFLNYPMIESYQDLETFPDAAYADRKISAVLQNGNEYKGMVRNTEIAKRVGLPKKIQEILMDRFQVSDKGTCTFCTQQILNINNHETSQKEIENILENVLQENERNTAKYQLNAVIAECDYLKWNVTYYEFMRKMFSHIICHNIRKANKIQNNDYHVEGEALEKCFFELDLKAILQEQNRISRDSVNGYIWVLNTCIFWVSDYNFQLLDKEAVEGGSLFGQSKSLSKQVKSSTLLIEY